MLKKLLNVFYSRCVGMGAKNGSEYLNILTSKFIRAPSPHPCADVNDFGLQRLCKATTLRRLNLDSRHFTDAGLVHVARLPRLETLDLFGAQVTDAGCAVLANATTLTSLEVCSGAVTDAGVAKLAELASLRHLSLAQNFRVGNGAIPALMRLSHLTALNLSQVRSSFQQSCLKGLQ